MNLLSIVLLIAALILGGSTVFMALGLARARRLALDKAESHLKAEEEGRRIREKTAQDVERESRLGRERAQREAEAILKDAELKAKELALQSRQEAERLLKDRQANLDKQEQRLNSKEEALDKKNQAADQRQKEQELKAEKQRAELEKLQTQQEEGKRLVAEQGRKLEEIAGLSREEAKAQLIGNLEYEAKMDAAKMVRRIEDEAQEEALKKARWTIGTAIQRVASDVVCETAVTSVQLPSDDLKGRIIGREGRNIRAIEKATGCDLIVDDTPETIVVSSFDPIRREVARQAILKLLADGRIHPARIEEVVEKTKVEMDHHLKEIGEQACIELGFPDVNPKLQKLVGRLNYRTSYGQNVLEHTKEVARIAEYMAAEMGADQRLARRAGLFHDIGKAIDREVEGTHIEIGMELMRRFGEKEEVIHAMSCHHGDFEPKTVEAMLITAADALSAARPGARREMLETYVKRLEDLERVALSFGGISKSYAIQAGREIRLIVESEKVNDEEAILLSREVAKKIEQDLTYPGQIKVTVIRETRSVEYAR